MTAIISIVSRYGLRIGAHHNNQPSKTKMGYISWCFHLKSPLKQLYINNKMRALQSWCGICVSAFKRRAGLGCR